MFYLNDQNEQRCRVQLLLETLIRFNESLFQVIYRPSVQSSVDYDCVVQ